MTVHYKDKFHNKNYILFYDTDCGFCHFTCRVIKRLDVFNQITYADTSYQGKKPIKLEFINCIKNLLQLF